jgi:hypothetical protein
MTLIYNVAQLSIVVPWPFPCLNYVDCYLSFFRLLSYLGLVETLLSKRPNLFFKH